MTATSTQQISTAATTDPILRASGIRKLYRMGESKVEVLKGIDLAVRAGEFIAIEGRSGSGKSTLLHILGGLESLDGGSVEFNGVDYTAASSSESLLKKLSRWIFRGWVGGVIACLLLICGSAVTFIIAPNDPRDWAGMLWNIALKLSFVNGALILSWIAMLITRAIVHHGQERPLTKLRNQQFGFVFQFYHLLPELNVLENTSLAPMIGSPAHLTPTEKGERRQRARKILEELGMGHRLKHRPAQLSGGERQRVAIARALMNKPRVLFADEPTGNLDAETGKQIMAVFEGLHRDHKQTVVMVTHDRSLARRADRVLILRDGKIERAAEVARDASRDV